MSTGISQENKESTQFTGAPSTTPGAPIPAENQVAGAEEECEGPPPALAELVDESGATVEVVAAPVEGGASVDVVVNHNLQAGSWDELQIPPKLMEGIVKKGFKKPSLIQARALPTIINTNSSVIGQAQNGSGKTATFALGLLSKINPSAAVTQAIVVCPNRELSLQNRNVILELGQFMDGLKVGLVVATGAEGPKETKADFEVPVLVGTLGKLSANLKKRLIDLSKVKIFVVDEVDYFLKDTNSQGPQLLELKKKTPLTAQVLLFSATFDTAEVRKVAEELAPRSTKVIINKTAASLTVNTIIQMFSTVHPDPIKLATKEAQEAIFEAKYKRLVELYQSMTIGQSIIFVKTRKAAGIIAKRMQEDEGQGVSMYVGSGNQNNNADTITVEQRDQILAEFKSGKTKVLVATDVLSRGIDVSAVTLVVNFDVPLVYSTDSRAASKVETDTYLHRIARTGRFGKWGVAVNLVTPEEVALVRSIENKFEMKMQEVPADIDELEDTIKELTKKAPIVEQQQH